MFSPIFGPIWSCPVLFDDKGGAGMQTGDFDGNRREQYMITNWYGEQINEVNVIKFMKITCSCLSFVQFYVTESSMMVREK